MANHKNRNPVFNATLEGLRKAIIDAGMRRDGTGVARCDAALMVLSEIGYAMAAMDIPADAPKRVEVSRLHLEAVEKALFCAIHDQFARGEIDHVAYGDALEGVRALLAARSAQKDPQ